MIYTDILMMSREIVREDSGGHQCFSCRVGLFKLNLMKRPPMTNDVISPQEQALERSFP